MSTPEPSMDYFPLFADLRTRVCLIIGQTRLADEKAAQMERAGAIIRRSSVFRREEAFEADLIVADVDEDQALQIKAFGQKHRRFVNIVDKPDYCSFIFPALVQRGDLLVAVSTSGRSPGFAGWLRSQLDSYFGEEYAELLRALGETRDFVKQKLDSYPSRRLFYRQLFRSGLLQEAKKGGRNGAKRRIEEHLRSFTP